MAIKYRKTGKIGLFDTDKQREKLSSIVNPLERILKVIDFEMFRPQLEEKLLNHDKTSNVGAKPIDVVPMFKILFIKRTYNLSD